MYLTILMNMNLNILTRVLDASTPPGENLIIIDCLLLEKQTLYVGPREITIKAHTKYSSDYKVSWKNPLAERKSYAIQI